MKCCRCGCRDMRRSVPRIWEWPLAVFGIDIVRCRRCRYRDFQLPIFANLQLNLKIKVPGWLSVESTQLPPALRQAPVKVDYSPSAIQARRPPGPIQFHSRPSQPITRESAQTASIDPAMVRTLFTHLAGNEDALHRLRNDPAQLNLIVEEYLYHLQHLRKAPAHEGAGSRIVQMPNTFAQAVTGNR